MPFRAAVMSFVAADFRSVGVASGARCRALRSFGSGFFLITGFFILRPLDWVAWVGRSRESSAAARANPDRGRFVNRYSKSIHKRHSDAINRRQHTMATTRRRFLQTSLAPLAAVALPGIATAQTPIS